MIVVFVNTLPSHYLQTHETQWVNELVVRPEVVVMMATDCRWWYRWKVAVRRSLPVVQSIILCSMEVLKDMSYSVVMDGGWVGTGYRYTT